MKYEDSKTIKPSKGAGKRVAMAELHDYKTSQLLWHLVKRHKFGVVGTWAVAMTILAIFPALPALVLALLGIHVSVMW